MEKILMVIIAGIIGSLIFSLAVKAEDRNNKNKK